MKLIKKNWGSPVAERGEVVEWIYSDLQATN